MSSCAILLRRACSRPGSVYSWGWPAHFSASFRQRSEADFQAARNWYLEVKGSRMIDEIGQISYSRSSGPGGQNVNKVNSKAQLRVPMEDLLPLLPAVLHEGIMTSRFYAAKTSCLLIQSDESRKQAANKEACYRRLNELILEVYSRTVPGETSDDQKSKVKKLKKVENEARLRLKKHISNKKASRRTSND